MYYKLLIATFIFLAFACKTPEELIKTGNFPLKFDRDTIVFDTIFTNQASITKRLKVINTSPNAMVIRSIRLAGMTSSTYSLIINGLKANQSDNLTLRGKDSITILVTALLDKKNISLPFLVTDSIIFDNANSEQKIILTAWGRDATYYRGDTIFTNTTWDSTTAKFIYKTITIAQGVTLTIQKGTKIYATKDNGIDVNGTLHVLGDSGKRDKVTFGGPRLDYEWRNRPGQWRGIVFNAGSVNNIINWAEISNAETAIQLGKSDEISAAILKITNTAIRNMSNAGILSYGADITSWNCLIANFANYGLACYLGGIQKHYNNTIASSESTFIRNLTAVLFTDGTSNLGIKANPIQLEFINNIVWGSELNEFNIITQNQANWVNSIIDYNIIRSNDKKIVTPNNLIYNFTVQDLNSKNKALGFKNYTTNLYEIDSTSVAKGKGLKLNIFNNALNNKLREPEFDIGCYQH